MESHAINDLKYSASGDKILVCGNLAQYKVLGRDGDELFESVSDYSVFLLHKATRPLFPGERRHVRFGSKQEQGSHSKDQCRMLASKDQGGVYDLC